MNASQLPETTQRLFIALWPDDELRESLAAECRRWPWTRAAAVQRAERLHITLHFLGDVGSDRVPTLRAALRGIGRVEPFDFVLDQAQVWRNGVASLQPGQVPPALVRLHVQIGVLLAALDLPLEQRAYRPHVTLARRAHGIAPVPPLRPLHWRAESFVLVESARGVAGYTVLEAFGR